MSDLLVAKTILAQLGGRGRLTAMTGAKNYLGDENSLSFRLPARLAKKGINRVTITLDGATDTYVVEGIKITQRLGNWKTVPIAKHELVYAEDLQRFFSEMTGLSTHI